MSDIKMLWKVLAISIVVLLSTVHSNILRCDLIDPHSRESEICWKQLIFKNYPQIVQETTGDTPNPVHTRNAELSSALMQLYGFNKFNGKRNPDFSMDAMRFMANARSDVGPYKEN